MQQLCGKVTVRTKPRRLPEAHGLKMDAKPAPAHQKGAGGLCAGAGEQQDAAGKLECAPQASASASRFGSRAVSPAARSTASIDEKKTMSPLTCSRAAQLPCTASGTREGSCGFSRRAVRRAADATEARDYFSARPPLISSRARACLLTHQTSRITGTPIDAVRRKKP